MVTPGQAGENPRLLDVIDLAPHRVVRVVADKAYSHPSTRTELRRRRIKVTIPERSDQIARRKAKGSRGGRPPAFDPTIYKGRNVVERFFNRIKEFRAIATRYDKLARNSAPASSWPAPSSAYETSYATRPRRWRRLGRRRSLEGRRARTRPNRPTSRR